MTVAQIAKVHSSDTQARLSTQKSRHPDWTKLRHLRATIENFTPSGCGNCFQQAVAMVMDMPTTKLVIGTLTNDHDHLHAWVVDRGEYYDPSRCVEDGGLRPYDWQHFISEGARDWHVIDRNWLLYFARKGSLSRWMLRQDGTYHTLGGIMGHVLLDELNIPYVVDQHGYLLPPT